MNREQRWLEELLADKGYKFLYSDGDDAYWRGFKPKVVGSRNLTG